ncbi:hypothetical protein [Tautonia plasticadhaerens]|uniref:Uncharacterized protein n=1 Tax=Tautonia plasticadhaerens TaxID=2527974 RepID=A0A518HFB0_9BACT|nr:hypothetical protein [Tautonia plasticadhaerens]QDV39466.1 hypothetical protein ElP_74330 [Tautonia plasticadhaerens]
MKKATIVATLFGALLAFAAAAQTAKAQVPPSGLQLGASVTPFVGPAPGQGPAAAGGLRVNYTQPGYPAHGLLLPGDVLHGGWDGYQYAPLLTMADIEAFKARIGPNRYGALQVYRPGVGYTYFWLRFTPVGTTFVAELVSEAQKPGAQAKFEGK